MKAHMYEKITTKVRKNKNYVMVFFTTENVSPIRTFLRSMAGRGKALKREVGTNRSK